jgi:hypothetical protein
MKPGPARQLPEHLSGGKVASVVPPSMVIVSQEDLDNVKLRPTTTRTTRKYFPPRNPVLEELLVKTYHKKHRRLVCEAVRSYFAAAAADDQRPRKQSANRTPIDSGTESDYCEFEIL